MCVTAPICAPLSAGEESRTARPGLATLGRAFECAGEIGRQRRDDLDRRARARVREGEPGGVQELALEAEQARRAVLGVTGDRVADGLQVHPDLMGAAGLEAHAQQRELPERALELEVRDGLTRRLGVDRVPRARAAVAADRRVDRAAARGRAALDEREVLARDLAALDRLLQRQGRL